MPPMIFAEEYMEQTDGQLYDYKFFCMDGKVNHLLIITDRLDKDMETTQTFYDRDFNFLNFTQGGRPYFKGRHEKPKNFEKMISLAERLAAPFPFVRIDFYEVENRIYVGEMTFYPGGGLLPYEPADWDEKLGELINLPDKIKQDRKVYYQPLTPKETYMLEEKITLKEKKQYCIQKAHAQMGYYPNIRNPKSLNEKIIWLALYYKNSDIRIAADKSLAKKYIADKVGEKYVVPLLGVYSDTEEIEIEKLPKKFVCKANHGWGGNEVIVVKNKNTCAFDYLKTIMSNWLYPWNSYYYQNMCITDEKIETKIVIEEYLENEEGESLTDYKFYCYNGRPEFVLVVSGRNEEMQTRTFVDMEWNCLPVFRKGKKTASNPQKPKNVEEMIAICKALAKDFPLVRIDFYEVNGRVYVGEMTFTPGMFLGLRPIEMDFRLGESLDLSEHIKVLNVDNA